MAGLPAMLKANEVTPLLRGTGLPARELGALFDGRADDAAALQRAIDEAARQQRPLVLPAGVARLRTPLDLKGRYVAIVGDPSGQTVLKADGRLPAILDAQENREVIDSPLTLFGLTLDGSGTAQTGVRVRYRHRTVFDTLHVGGCDVGVDEVDAWLGRRMNCRVRGNGTGWQLRGSNHSSVWIGCSFIDARVVHLHVGRGATENDGNNALLFQGCDIEFGAGTGVIVDDGATATFDTCYLGEGIAGDVLRSAGTVLIRGGTLFVGHSADRFGIVPLAGTIAVTDASIAGQRFGSLERLVGGSATTAGHAVFSGINMQLQLGGNPSFAGDVLGTLPMRTFAPILGRNWTATTNDTAIQQASERDERTVRCTGVTGRNPVIGLAASLAQTADSRRNAPAYLAVVYTATRPVEVKVTSGAIGRAPLYFIGTLPAAPTVRTYVKADVPLDLTRFNSIELTMPGAGQGDSLTLQHATVSDASILEPGLMANLARAR